MHMPLHMLEAGQGMLYDVLTCRFRVQAVRLHSQSIVSLSSSIQQCTTLESRWYGMRRTLGCHAMCSHARASTNTDSAKVEDASG
jgi:hypothetical protein